MQISVLVLTVLLSAAAAGFATYYLNISKERLSFRATKAEELYRAAEALDRELTAYFTRSYCLHDGTAASGHASDLEKAGAFLVTVKMLVGFYFPALNDVLARTIAAMTTAHHGLGAVERLRDEARKDAIEALDSSVCDLRDSLDSLKATILREAMMTRQTGRRTKTAAPRARILEVPASA